MGPVVSGPESTDAVGGAGRGAVVISRPEGLEAADGERVSRALAADGWNVQRVDRAADRTVSELARREGIELVVALSAGGEDALSLAPLCTALHRLADPPVVLVCDFAPDAAPRPASSTLGADAIVRDPAELLRQASGRSPQAGQRRWGVRLRRAGRTLVLSPTGSLDSTSVGRLTDMLLNRAGAHDRIVIDLRDLAEIDRSGVAELAACAARLAPDTLWLMADESTRQRLAATEVALTLPVLDDLPVA
jgi:ABC-type transporter Mla MlaB component